MGSKLTKRPWKVAPITTKTFGQLQARKLLREEFGETVTRQQLYQFKEKHGFYPQFVARDPNYRLGHALYRVPKDDEPLSKHGPQGEPAKVFHKESPDEGAIKVSAPASKGTDLQTAPADAPTAKSFRNDSEFSAGDVQKRIEQLQREASALAYVPTKLKAFEPYGDYELVKTIIGGRKFLPVFTTGLSGIGKTLFWKQACAELAREYVRANITVETDEDDLIGGFRLRHGETYFDLGPVPVAMIRGAVLLLDEIDKASAKIMCLQPVLEGEPLTIKKLGVTIQPAPGFTVAATANTKGQGDDTGKFITSTLLDEAFLERFPITLEHDFADKKTEQTILTKTFQFEGGVMTASTRAFFTTLAAWAETIRAAYRADAAENNVISTRRLCHIVRTFAALGASDKQNQGRAIALCLNRFDEKTKTTFIDLYNKHVNDDGTPSNVGSLNPPSGW